MWRFTPALISCYFVCWVGGALKADEAKPPPAAGKKIAIVVGINTYQQVRFENLKFAERDATELAKVLGEHGFAVQTLLGSAKNQDRATKANIEKSIADTCDKLTKNDLLIVAFSGHGQQSLNGKMEQPYFCPLDGKSKDTKTLVGLADLMKQLGESKTGNAFVLADIDRSFEDVEQGGSEGEIFEKLSLRQGLSVLTATSRRSVAYESEKAGGGHGLFTHAVIKGLQGHAGRGGTVTWEGLASYVRETVPDLSTKYFPNNRDPQHPHLIANLAGKPVILVSDK